MFMSDGEVALTRQMVTGFQWRKLLTSPIPKSLICSLPLSKGAGNGGGNNWDDIDPSSLDVVDEENGNTLDKFLRLEDLRNGGMGIPQKPLFIVMPKPTKKRRMDEGEEEESIDRVVKALIESNQFDEAWARFVATAKGFVGDTPEEEHFEKCNPTKIKYTWEGEKGPKHLGKLLSEQCSTIDLNIRKIVARQIDAEKGHEDQVKADYRDGVLTVTVPKAEEPKPRSVQISVE